MHGLRSAPRFDGAARFAARCAALLAVAIVLAPAAVVRADDGTPEVGAAADAAAAAEASRLDAQRARLLADLSSEAAAVRDQAATRLETIEGLTAAHVGEAMRDAPSRSRTLLIGVAAARGFGDLAPQIAEAAAGPDAQVAEAAIRALVSLGEPGVAAGRKALADAPARDEATAPDPAAPPVVETSAARAGGTERAARRRHLDALDIQRRVEHDVISRWRRKGGAYRGRYATLASHGWDAQPVLLAMLLDVPLEDQFVIVPESGEPQLDSVRRTLALRELALSRRRGYRTFDPLPATIELDEMFELAEQALADVADLDLMRDVLEDTHRDLKMADDAADWRPRNPERAFAQAIEVILSARGAPERLDARRRAVESEVNFLRQRTRRVRGDDEAEALQLYSVRLQELAAVLHQLGRFDDAEVRFQEVIDIVRKLSDKEPSVTGYNRACSLVRGERLDEAMAQLERALDPAISSGTEDLTREWVTEDGDLEPLHRNPRWAALVKKRFGP